MSCIDTILFNYMTVFPVQKVSCKFAAKIPMREKSFLGLTEQFFSTRNGFLPPKKVNSSFLVPKKVKSSFLVPKKGKSAFLVPKKEKILFFGHF